MRLDEEMYSTISPYQSLICHEKGHLSFHACVAEISPLLDVERFDQGTGAALLYLEVPTQNSQKDVVQLALCAPTCRKISREALELLCARVESRPEHQGLYDEHH